MISLTQILSEIEKGPKAIILAGAPGAGKGYILRGLDLGSLKVLNIDNIFIDMLKKSNITLDLKNATPEERSQQAISMAAANKDFKQDVTNTIKDKQSFILDGTGASFKQTSQLKQELESAGYQTMMLYVYTDLERSLLQNQNRYEKSDGKDRSLAPAIVMRTWNSVTKNYTPYKELFGDNFVSVANTLEDKKLDTLKDIIKTYLEPFKPQNTKPKDDKAKARSAESFAELEADIKILLSDGGVKDIIDSSVSKEEAQSKLKSFLTR